MPACGPGSVRSPTTTSRSLTHVVQEAHEGAPLRVHGLGKVLEMLDNIFIFEIDLSEHGRWICCDVGRAVKHRQRQAALAPLFVVALIAFLRFAGLHAGRPVRGAHNAVLECQEALLERLQLGSLGGRHGRSIIDGARSRPAHGSPRTRQRISQDPRAAPHSAETLTRIPALWYRNPDAVVPLGMWE